MWMLSSTVVVGVYSLFNAIEDIEDSSAVVVRVCLLLNNIGDDGWESKTHKYFFYTPGSWHGPQISLRQPSLSSCLNHFRS